MHPRAPDLVVATAVLLALTLGAAKQAIPGPARPDLPSPGPALDFGGSTVVIAPSDLADYEVTFHNYQFNNLSHEGMTGTLSINAIEVEVEFSWDVAGPSMDNDAIQLTPPPGYACEPASCYVDVREGGSAIIYLFRIFTSGV